MAGPAPPPGPPAGGDRAALLPRPARGRGRPPHEGPAGHGQVLDPPRPGPPARPPRPHLRRRAPGRQPQPGGRPMTVEDRVRRVLTEAAATEPPPRTAPLAAVRRRRRRRPLLAGATALILVLAATAALVAVRTSHRPLPSTD